MIQLQLTHFASPDGSVRTSEANLSALAWVKSLEELALVYCVDTVEVISYSL